MGYIIVENNFWVAIIAICVIIQTMLLFGFASRTKRLMIKLIDKLDKEKDSKLQELVIID